MTQVEIVAEYNRRHPEMVYDIERDSGLCWSMTMFWLSKINQGPGDPQERRRALLDPSTVDALIALKQQYYDVEVTHITARRDLVWCMSPRVRADAVKPVTLSTKQLEGPERMSRRAAMLLGMRYVNGDSVPKHLTVPSRRLESLPRFLIRRDHAIHIRARLSVTTAGIHDSPYHAMGMLMSSDSAFYFFDSNLGEYGCEESQACEMLALIEREIGLRGVEIQTMDWEAYLPFKPN